MFRKILSLYIMFSFILTQTGFAQVASSLDISRLTSGTITQSYTAFRPAHLRSFSYDSARRSLDLLIEKGDTGGTAAQATAAQLLGYFQVGITLPNSLFWVNLRPDGQEQVMAPELQKTDLGKVLIEADLQLKKDFSLLTSPDNKEGKAYWDRLYAKAETVFGSKQVAIPTMARPWIVPGDIVVRESADSAYIYKATLRVMLEQDYLKTASQYSFADSREKELNAYSTQLLRELVLPKLAVMVNSSRSYASLRQVYYSLIFAQWFKSKFAGSSGTYASRIDTRDLSGLKSSQGWSTDTYFNAYSKSFSQGEYNRQVSSQGGQGMMVRRYTFGGIGLGSCFTSTGGASSARVLAVAAKGGIFDRLADSQSMVRAQVSETGAVAIVPIDNNVTGARDGGDSLDEKIARLESKYSPEAMAERINAFIGAEAMRFRAAVSSSDRDKIWDGLVNALNAREVLRKLPNLVVAPIKYVEDYQNDDLAIESLLSGELVLTMPFAGAGTRMENSLSNLAIRLPHAADYRLANVKIWQLVEAMGKQVYEKALAEGKSPQQAEQAVIDAGLVRKFPAYVNKELADLGLGERAMLALEQGIVNLKKSHGLTDEQVQQIQQNLKIIVNVSDEIQERTHQIFLSPSRVSGKKFFGFNAENIVFVSGGYGPGFEFDATGKLVPNKQKVSWNHGFAFAEIAWIKGSNAYRLTGRMNPMGGTPEVRAMTESVAKYVLSRGGKYSCIHRINDMILLHPDMALDVQMFGAFRNLLSLPGNEKVNMYLEMMANPTNQKGGLALSEDGQHLILLEGLATKDTAVEQKLNELAGQEMRQTQGQRGVPYNRLYGYYKIEDVLNALAEDDMPLLIKHKNGMISPEIPTGDITWVKGVNALAGVRKHDLLVEQGFVSNEQRDVNNEAIRDDAKNPKKAYLEGSGSIIHDMKEAKYIKDGREMAGVLDDPRRGVFEPAYYQAVGESDREGMLRTINSNPVTKKIRENMRGQMRALATELRVSPDDHIFASRLHKAEGFLAVIAERMNGQDPAKAIHPNETYIRVNESQPDIVQKNRVSRVGVYPVAANPLHWDHFLAALEAMAAYGLDKVVFDIQSGKDMRKETLAYTESYRYELAKKELAMFAPLFEFSENVSEDGETDIFRIMELNSKQKIDAFYIVGGDHYNRWAKDGDTGEQLKDSDLIGSPDYNAWVAKHGKAPQPDTIQKLETNLEKAQKTIDSFKQGLHNMSVIFIIRGKEKDKPKTSLKGLDALPEVGDASATRVRRAIQGVGPTVDQGLFPETGYTYIQDHIVYKNLLILDAIEKNIEEELTKMAEELLGNPNAKPVHLPQLASRLIKARELIRKIRQRVVSTDPSRQIHPDRLIRVSENDPVTPATNDVYRIGIYPVAANPLHWDHFLAALQAISEVGLDKVVFDIQSGKDVRKPILASTERYRYELAKKEFELFAPLFMFSENVSSDGETDIFRILKLNPGQKIDAFYIVGGDHYNRWSKDRNTGVQAPDDLLKGTPEYSDWVIKNGFEPQPDTLQKLEENPVKEGLNALMHSISVIFIQRGNAKAKPKTTLKNLEVLPEVGDGAATDIRKALAGELPRETLAILPYMGFKYIQAHPEYKDMLVNPEKYEKKDGGENQGDERTAANKPGGIDMRSLPIRSQATLSAADIGAIEAMAAKDGGQFAATWRELEKRMRMGVRPYRELKIYAYACRQRADKRQVELVHKSIAELLRKEEMAGQETAAEVANILDCLN